MSMLEWAKNEIAIASKRERGDKPEDEWDCGCACYDSALRAFENLLGDGHSGMSIGFTKDILNRLIDGKPLTPIEDTEDTWEYIYNNADDSKVYRCKRMSSLHKKIAQDGIVTYSDVDRYYCTSNSNPHLSWHNGFIASIYNEMYPLTFPYMPSSIPDVIVCEELLTDRKNGDYDTIAILYIIRANEDKVDINRYFKESEISFTEISSEEYKERQRLHENRIKAEGETDI